jgi:transcriptional regulator of arginine metabolism
MMTRGKRRELILDLVSRNEIENQEQLQALLEVEGVTTTQATISRDLRDLSISKGPHGYAVVKLEDVSRVDLDDLQRSLKQDATSVERAGTLVVVRTHPGHGRPLGIKIDQANFPQSAGTIAGDDTIFIATRSASQATEIRRLLRDLAR